YTPPEEEAEYQFKIYARDNAEPDPLVTSTDTETFYVVPDTQISTGFNQSVFNMDEISASQGSSFNVETVFANTGTGDRGQTAENVNYEVNLPNSTWNAEPSSKELGSIEYGENKSENIKITIPAGTSPGTYRPQVITEWKNADGNINTTERRFKVVVEENPELSVSADLKTVSMENNDTSEFSTTITSSGNTRVESISVDCEEGEACEDLYISSETPVSLAPGEESQLNVTIEAPAGVPDKIYEGELVVAGLKAKDNMSLNVDIAKELDFKSKPSETNISAGPGAELILDSIVLQNTGNQPLEVSAPYSENIVFDPSDMSLGVNDEESMDVRLYAPEDPGNYAYNLTIDLYDHQTFEKLTAPYNVSLEVYDYTISLQDISKEKEIVPGDETTMEVEAQFEGTEITSNVNWDAYIGERKADIVGSSYNTDKGVWEVTVEAPELQQGRKYTLHLEGEWQEKNVRNNVEKEDRIWYKDTEGPVFSYLDAEDVKNTDSTIRTEITDPGEVANVSTVNATVYQPSGGELEPEMTRDDDLWKGEVTSGFLSETGYYDVEVSAGDTAGNVNSNSTFIQVYEDLPVSGEIYAPDGTGVPTTLKLFRPNTSAEIHEINAEQGNYSKTIRTGTYDLLIEANNTAHIQLYNVTGEDLKGNMINIDPNIPNAYVDLPNSSNENELYGVSVNTSEFKNAQGTIALDYRDYEYQLENVRYLSLYKCENWGFDDQEKGCQSSWEKETTAIVPDEKLAITDLDGFSAYYLAEKGGYDDPNATEPPADENETTDNETSTDDGTSGGSGGTIVNPGSGDDGGLEEDEFQSGIDQLLDALKDNRSESLVDFTNQRIDATLKPAQERTTAVNIKNNVNVSQMLETALSSSLQKYVYVKDSLNLSAGETEELPVVISIPGDAEPNTYSGYLTITGSAVEKEIPINIEIVPREKKLLDLVIEPVFSSITPGTNLRVQASLSNQGYSRNVDVDLNLEMFDPERNMTVAKTSTTVAVATTVDKVLEIEIPEDLMLKTYELRATASYSNKEAQSVARSIKNIDVRKPFWEQRIQGIQHRTLALAIVVLLISGLSSYAYYQRWKQKMLKKKRYTENIDLDTIPSGGERQAFVGELAEMGTKTYAKLDDLTTHTLIAGATGSGKTVTGQVMVEEALKKGATVIVLDPTAQWSGYLRECNDKGMLQHYDRFGMSKDEAQAFDGNIRAIEPGEEIDITPYLDNENSQGEIIVFSMHKLDSKNLDEFVNNTIQQVFDANLPERNELDTVIVYDEVHRLLDKFGGSGKGLKQLERGAREFRKWGVGMILLSQVISDFSGEIRANIGTTIQMRTQYENDLERMKDKFNMDTVKSIVKAEVGSGMLQNSEYNHGRPYFVDFRPLLHSPHRLTDEELEKYEEYNRKIDSVEEKIQELEDQGEEVYEFRSELKLAKRNLRKGSFNLVDIYLDELKENVEEKL
ncbi:MAG: DUF853 family protein, partial [Candidatus Nanohaloarchaeota archaeon QJJ-9]|nr:DUF853 family protein [Candidatus Nanohaloarchaeota archaeon QJJ-9]